MKRLSLLALLFTGCPDSAFTEALTDTDVDRCRRACAPHPVHLVMADRCQCAPTPALQLPAGGQGGAP